MRLKERKSNYHYPRTHKSFYSKLVRLKDDNTAFAAGDLFEFLFQTGAIKSGKETDNERNSVLFLFQTGAIKRLVKF